MEAVTTRTVTRNFKAVMYDLSPTLQRQPHI